MQRWLPVAILMLAAVRAPAVTKTVEVGPSGRLRFVDDESGTSTTTITAGDTVKWVWRSSGHSSTRTDGPKTWDSEVRDAPFTFSQTFPDPGTYRYRCTPHGFLGMVGTVRVVAEGGSGSTTTTTTPAPATCDDPAAIAAVRAQIDEQCDCAGAPRHRAYVRCATRVVKAAITAGLLPRVCRASVRRCAARSTCGRPGFVTCCRTTSASLTTCSIRRDGAHCKAPPGGAACVGSHASCCDACTADGCAPGP